MKPKNQARKKIVAGITNALRFFTSSRNSGDRSAASQSTGDRCPSTVTRNNPFRLLKGLPLFCLPACLEIIRRARAAAS